MQINNKSRMEQLQKAEDEKMKIRIANMNVYEAEKTRLAYDFMKGRSRLTQEQLNDAIDEIERKEKEESYKQNGF